MRPIILLLISVLIAIPAGAAKRATVAQLEQRLNAAIAAHKSDEEIARQVADLELSERLTNASIERLSKSLTPGSQTALSLQLLADLSAFLDPPQSELPAIAAPDAASQQQMLNAGRSYVSLTLPRLPNFLATRTISRFDNRPAASKQGDWGLRQGLHVVDSSSQEISVSVERENQPPTESSAVWQAQIGLISGGEFGTTLGMILTDTVQGKITWSHWENDAGNRVAVFQYSVPRSASHFQVIGYRERTDLVGLGSVTRGSAPPRSGVLAGDPSNMTVVHSKPGYHGSFWLDPATGTILRITLEADSKDGNPFQRAAMLVQYGSVLIGESRFVCPTRSLAFSVAVPDPHALFGNAPTEWLNVTQFTRYHRFASTVRILPDKADTQPVKPGIASEVHETSAVNSSATPFIIGKTLANSSQVLSGISLIPPAISVHSPQVAVVSSPVSPVSNPVTVASQAIPPQTTAPTIEINVNRILIPVVVRDKSGHTISGLTREDFKVIDNDKQRSISAFLVERRGPESAESHDNSGEHHEAQVSPHQVLPSRIIIFLFDDMHLSYEDLSHATKAASTALGRSLGDSDLAAVVSISGNTNSGLTRDTAKLRGALSALRPQGIYRTDANDCPKIDYYQADLIENKHDNAALQDAITQVVKVCNPRLPVNLAEAVVNTSARRALMLGDQDVRATYFATSEFVRRIAKMPGERTLVLVSSGFLTIEQEARTLESQLIDLAAQSNVAISAIDARGLYTASLTASDDMRRRTPELVADYRRTSMHLAEDSMAELADGTGGLFFHNSNDLDAGFKRLTDVPETVYLLELSLDNIKMDGSYHRLNVKLTQGGFDVNARHGYFAPKPEKNKK